jgi:hypothetical protein
MGVQEIEYHDFYATHAGNMKLLRLREIYKKYEISPNTTGVQETQYLDVCNYSRIPLIRRLLSGSAWPFG